MENVGIFYGHLEYFTDIWNILRTLGVFYDLYAQFVTILDIFPVLVYCLKKNLATLLVTANLY
jgi:hypothetical protein